MAPLWGRGGWNPENTKNLGQWIAAQLWRLPPPKCFMLMDGWRPHSLTSNPSNEKIICVYTWIICNATCKLCMNQRMSWIYYIFFLIYVLNTRAPQWLKTLGAGGVKRAGYLKNSPALFNCFKGSGCRHVLNFTCHHAQLWIPETRTE